MLIKQTAAVAFLAFVFWQVFTSWYTHLSVSIIIRQLVVIGMAAIAPILVFLVGFYAKTGSLADLFYWVIGYHLEGRYIAYSVEPLKLTDIGRIASCFILVPFAAVCAFDLMRRRDRNWLNFGLGLLILITGAVSAYPRFAFFHLQSVLPVVALLSAMTLSYAFKQLRSWRTFAFGIVVAFSAFFFVKAGIFYRPAFRADRHPIVDEYSDLLPLTQEIRSTIGETDSVYVFPDDEASANLYYLLQRKPPKFWIFHYNWYLLDWTKAKILATLEDDPPDWVVYFHEFLGRRRSSSRNCPIYPGSLFLDCQPRLGAR